ncbi:MAG: methyltransferase domain-containing protein [Bryocella sp.]
MLPSSRDFAQRSDPAALLEWMDQPCSYAEFRACLLDLAKVNKLLLAPKPLLRWLQALHPTSDAPLHLVDVGCGGGDLLRHVADWARSRSLPVQLTGIDMNPMATRAAAEFSTNYPEIRWITGRAEEMLQHERIDVVTSTLCTHHMQNAEIVPLLRWMEATARRGWFISDLRRSRVNYVLFTLLARIAHWHPFVQHDGPVSIQRSFRASDWKQLCAAAQVKRFTLNRAFAGRLCVSSLHE